MLLGFSPLHLAKKGILTWFGIVGIVSIPLYTSFSNMQEDIDLQSTLSHAVFQVGNETIKLEKIELIHLGKKDEIHCEVISSGQLSKVEKKLLKKEILVYTKKEMDIIATFRYRL